MNVQGGGELGTASGGHLLRIGNGYLGYGGLGKKTGVFGWARKVAGSYKTVPATRQRLNITRILRIVRQRGANLVDAEVDAAVEVDEGVVAP